MAHPVDGVCNAAHSIVHVQTLLLQCPDPILGLSPNLLSTYYPLPLTSLAWHSDLQKVAELATFLSDVLGDFRISPPWLITMATIYILDCTVLAMFLVPFPRLGDEF
jgi:hypothetical protein